MVLQCWPIICHQAGSPLNLIAHMMYVLFLLAFLRLSTGLQDLPSFSAFFSSEPVEPGSFTRTVGLFEKLCRFFKTSFHLVRFVGEKFKNFQYILLLNCRKEKKCCLSQKRIDRYVWRSCVNSTLVPNLPSSLERYRHWLMRIRELQYVRSN